MSMKSSSLFILWKNKGKNKDKLSINGEDLEKDSDTVNQ